MAGGELRRLWGDGLGRAERLKAADEEDSAGEAVGVKEEPPASEEPAEEESSVRDWTSSISVGGDGGGSLVITSWLSSFQNH